MAYPHGRITIVPRTGPFSASSALATTSWYQRGKSVAWGVSTGALAMAADPTAHPAGIRPPFRPHRGHARRFVAGLCMSVMPNAAKNTRRGSEIHGAPGQAVGGEHRVGGGQRARPVLVDPSGAGQGGERDPAEIGGAEVGGAKGEVGE